VSAIAPAIDRATRARLARLSVEARAARLPFARRAAEALALGEDEVLARCAADLGWPLIDSDSLQSAHADFDALPFPEAARRQAVALATDRGLAVAIDDPFDTDRIDWLERGVGKPFEFALAAAGDIAALLRRHEDGLRAIDTVVGASTGADDGAAAAGAEELSIARIADDASPVVRLVSSMLYDALKAEASDVHLESDPRGAAIRYRLDGVLETVGRIDGAGQAEQVVSRIKVLSELDIAERRVPQDGRFQVRVDRREIDLRVSVLPAVHGEDVVIRILDKKRLVDEVRGLRFETLGFDAVAIDALRRLARLPFGLMLVTGPTGSGKTTTLYAALSEVNNGRDKIVTIEDPIEYQLPGVTQIPVNDRRGLTFSRGLRSILRHDPDKILVGEIRDPETAQIAVQAALTGHLVFTTVHANSVFDVMGRLLHIGVDPFSLVSALNGVVAQRLVRINCSHCARPVVADLDARPAHERMRLRDRVLMSGTGCGHCRGTGFRGRRAIAEVLAFDDAMRDALSDRTSVATAKEAARQRGMRSIRDAGLELVASGLTTLDELDRVTFADHAAAGGAP
jgi:general secretion pathway protein E